jgi:hypothetical protein
MISMNLQGIAEVIVRQAQRQGFILPREVRAALTKAGLSPELWKDVLAVARPNLTFRKGRYYYSAPISDRVRKERSQQHDIQQAVRQIIQQYRSAAESVERRVQDRVDFIQPVRVRTEDQREYTLLSRDLSATGIRLIGTRGFLGQKVQVSLPGLEDKHSWSFLVRILWTSAVGADLVENGGTFIEVASEPQE